MTISIANQQQQQQPQNSSPNIHIPYAGIRNDKALCWIYENIQQHKLYQKLKYLISDAEHLSTCYEITAFLQNEQYQTALFLCLKACETNQQNLLSQINVELYTDGIVIQTNHKRSTSHPEFSFLPPPQPSPSQQGGKCQIDGAVMGCKHSISFSYDTDASPSTSCRSSRSGVENVLQLSEEKIELSPAMQKLKNNRYRQRRRKNAAISVSNLKLRPWHSLPNVTVSTESYRTRSHTLTTQPIHIPYRKIRLTADTLAINNGQKVPSFSYKQLASDSASSNNAPSTAATCVDDLKTISLVKCDDIKIHFDTKHRPKSSFDNTASQHITNLTESLTKSPKPVVVSSSSQSTGIFSFINRDAFSLFNSTSAEKQIDSMASSFLATSSASSDFVRTFLPPRQGEKIQNRYHQQRSMMMNFGAEQQQQQLSSYESAAARQPTTNSYYSNRKMSNQSPSLPLHGQSLTSFLQAGQFSRVSNELERENAHFSVSEAMISAIEQIKWTNLEKLRAKQRLKANAQRLGVTVKKKKNRERCMRDWDSSAAASYSFDGGAAIASPSSRSLSTSDNSIESHFSADSDDTSDDAEIGEPKYLKVK